MSNRGQLLQDPFLNKCDEAERSTVAEYYQRCFNEELPSGSMLREAG